MQKSRNLMIQVWDHQRVVHDRVMRRQDFDRYQGMKWTRETIPLAQKTSQLYGYMHNVGNAKHNLLTHYAFKRKLSKTVVSQCLSLSACSRFNEVLLKTESTLLSRLSTQGLGYTLFAPVNEGFETVSDGWSKFLSDLSMKREYLDRFVSAHAFKGLVRPTDFCRFRTLKNLLDMNVKVKTGSKSLSDKGTTPVELRTIRTSETSVVSKSSTGSSQEYPYSKLLCSAPFRCSNGFVYVIDRPLAMSNR